MKKLLFALVTMLCLTACHRGILDSISDLQSQYQDLDARVTRLENLCKEMNTNIAALQTIVNVLQSNDYITNVTEIKKNGTVIGYSITFGKHEPITIYNGEDGKDGINGSNGQDGYTPIVGVAQDTDGKYYWTLDGEWLLNDQGQKIPVTGEKGDKGDTGAAGQDGTNGTNGQNGIDGITPQLKIEDGFWFVSYNGGTSWTLVGKATGDKGDKGDTGATGPAGQNGTNGTNGQDGDSMFQSVTQDENNVYFTLADGTVITIAKNTGSGTHNPMDIIEFRDPSVKARLLDYVDIDTNQDGEISYAEASAFNREIAFSDNTFIVSFKELQYFNNINSVYFKGCTNLAEVILPNHLTQIRDNAFYGTQIRYITIPTECLSIGASAFANCPKLKHINFNEVCTTIGQEAGIICKQDTLRLPNSISSIGKAAFGYAGEFQTLILPESLISGAEEMLSQWFNFYKKFRLTSIVWNCINYSSPVSYNNTLFGLTQNNSSSYDNQITTFEIGQKVRIIPAYLCYHMRGISTITLPASVVNIGTSAFEGTNIATVYSQNPTPPTIGSKIFPSTVTAIYVPQNSVSAYQSAWSTYASKIVGYDFE